MTTVDAKEEPVCAPDEEEVGGLDADDGAMLELISSEEENASSFKISRTAAGMCNLVKSILEGGMHNT